MSYIEYYKNQAKSQIGGNQVRVFKGSQYQSGYGLGGIFNTLKNAFSWLLPILKTHSVPALKSGAEIIGKELIKTASNVPNDAIDGKQIKVSFQNRLKEGINKVLSQAQNNLKGGKRKISQIHKKKKIRKLKKDIFA